MVDRRHSNPFIAIAARLLMILAAFLLLLSYASMVANPAQAWYMTIFGLAFVPLALLNCLFLFIAIRRGSRSLMIPLLVLLPSLLFIGRYFQFSSGAEKAEDGVQTIKVLTYNVGHFSLGTDPRFNGDESAALCADSLAAFILKNDPDVVCLQEVGIPGGMGVRKFIGEHFPGYEAAYFIFPGEKRAYGNIILSRFPIVDKGKLTFEESSNLAVYADLRVRDGVEVRVYNCHFESYNISLSRFKKSILDKNTDQMIETEQKMKKAIRRRPEQVDLVMSDIEGCTQESIVTGDFNDNPMSYTYNRLKKGRRDSFVEAGKGFGATYSFLWPFIRIDYILYPSHFGCVSHTVPRVKYSDHYPVIAEISLKQ